MERLRVLVADDHPLLRQGVQTLLSHQFDVVGAVSDGQSLIDMAAELRPDIIVTDISMPLMSGLDAVRQIKRRLPATMFVFLTVHSNPVYVQRALQVHASAYVLKSEAAEELLTAIEHALRGEVYLSPALGNSILERFRTASGRPSRSSVELTGRQRQILQCIAEGRQNKEIAHQLSIGTKTVEFHRARLMSKLGLHSVGQLTRFAIEEGLVGVSSDLQTKGASAGR
jgi:DNA-binding NarL/FixJ family response regulator